MLEIRHLTAGYGNTPVLDGLSLTCESGTVTTLIGPNGCGKSTLLKSIVRLVPHIEGDIRVDGKSLSDLSRKSLSQTVSYLSQGKNVPDITVFRMVLHGRFPYLSYPRRYRPADCEAAEQALSVMGLSELRDRPLSALSGGMRQKVYLAMALCQETDLILLDEPATYLDIAQQLRLSTLLRRLSDEGKTILTVSHDITAALASSDRIAVMESGTLRVAGTPDEILRSAVIPAVFGVNVERIDRDSGPAYIYTTPGREADS